MQESSKPKRKPVVVILQLAGGVRGTSGQADTVLLSFDISFGLQIMALLFAFESPGNMLGPS